MLSVPKEHTKSYRKWWDENFQVRSHFFLSFSGSGLRLVSKKFPLDAKFASIFASMQKSFWIIQRRCRSL